MDLWAIVYDRMTMVCELQRILNTAPRILCIITKFGYISKTLVDLH